LWESSNRVTTRQSPSAEGNNTGRTALMAVTAGERREKEIVANRREPAGTGAGGVISDTRPYGYDLSYFIVPRKGASELTYSK
jgi:hypothetical protein